MNYSIINNLITRSSKFFGCECFPYLRPFQHQKLNFKLKPCLFLDYSPNHKGYKCFSNSGRLYISRNVIFNETTFPYAPKSPIMTHSDSPTSPDVVPSIPIPIFYVFTTTLSTCPNPKHLTTKCTICPNSPHLTSPHLRMLRMFLTLLFSI